MLKALALTSLALATVLPSNVSAATSCGMASFYGKGDSYAWRTMANGQPMDPGANITAHRSLPFGTRLRVTNQNNGKSVVVRVTDRGPYYGGRILDLSHGSFSRIASPSSGVAEVCYTRLS
jgi:rare lipoprotein A